MFATVGVLDELEAVVDRVLGSDPAARSAAETEGDVLQLERVKAKLAALEARQCRKYDTEGQWALRGALHPAAVVATMTRTPSKSHRRPFTMGRKLAELPALLRSMAAGTISVAHRDKILATDNKRVHDAFVAEHDQMVLWAETLTWTEFEARLQRWLHRHDLDGPDPGFENRGVDLSQTWRDEWVLNGRLDAVRGAIVAAELKRLSDVLFTADWAEAKEQLGRDPLPHELARTPRQRRADALVLMAERSAVGPEDGRRGSYLFTVFIGEDSFRDVCELASGLRARPGQLAPFLDDSTYEVILLGGKFRDISASEQRTYRGALRRAVLGRDRQCTHEFCDKPADECQVDHFKPHSKGGPTSYEMGRGACAGHNRAKGAFDPTANPDDIDDP